MNKLDYWKRAIGLRLLRWAGYSIPTELLEKVMQPRILETRFSYTEDALLPQVEKMYNDKLEQICLAAKPYIITESFENAEITTIHFKLIVQTPL